MSPSLAFSPCPNACFIFDAIAQVRAVSSVVEWRIRDAREMPLAIDAMCRTGIELVTAG